jgi:hypothetical protein
MAEVSWFSSVQANAGEVIPTEVLLFPTPPLEFILKSCAKAQFQSLTPLLGKRKANEDQWEHKVRRYEK